jgi:PD-(D/E)XK endonuclease
VELSTDQKGAIAEAAIVLAAARMGIAVYRPLADGTRYDLIFDLGGRLERVQCKWAPKRGEVLVIRGSSSRRTASGLRRRSYAPGEIDALAAYSADLDRCFYLPADRIVGRLEVSLRLARSRNNQRAGINWAEDFAFERLRFETTGAVAQLGERCDGIAEVRGSIPLGSIGAGRSRRAGPTASGRRRSGTPVV